MFCISKGLEDFEVTSFEKNYISRNMMATIQFVPVLVSFEEEISLSEFVKSCFRLRPKSPLK